MNAVTPQHQPQSQPSPDRTPATTPTRTTQDAQGAHGTQSAHSTHENPDHEAGYRGPATLEFEGEERVVDVELRGTFQPVDGRYHWYGRVVGAPELVALLGGRRTAALIRTPQGEARGELSDPDPCYRYRVTGTSTPPFRVPGPNDPPPVA
ncbi:DUF4873 domain-containing protein [Streptomyces sp. 71268]|uniref:DUF4873 domain-containing protein n=1 Tax=Streptomyces sp. 71268 TaxID=3002640 RepID=UPI0023F78FBD|nr:DUF4873 domain-containing protein [Streptomyces sp. 71268]WEV25808.1 DUF4873 domain-containing protein [Streptomyces sp. 71268]